MEKVLGCMRFRAINKIPYCNCNFRQDKTNVIFKKIESEKPKVYNQETHAILMELLSYCSTETYKPRQVNTLKDLHGLKNNKGHELIFESTDNFKGKGYYQEWVMLDEKDDKGFFVAFYRLDDETVTKLKSIGFEFEHKPFRTKEEILSELVEKDFEFGKINYVLVQNPDGKYARVPYSGVKLHGAKYYTIDSIDKVMKELNKLPKGDK